MAESSIQKIDEILKQVEIEDAMGGFNAVSEGRYKPCIEAVDMVVKKAFLKLYEDNKKDKNNNMNKFTAEEALKISDQNKDHSFGLIIHLIKQAASVGEYSVVVDIITMKDFKNRLEQLGFTLEKNGLETKVSWNRKP